ncbi:hypothetical protein LOTGIDRAFT_174195 [Lottia gigantea]|uniref:G-protein coupled receptors family 1 profile domain-containing protein n=1 Tax=Lottia gigantea TaxID=225164 RepID=V4AUC2_LOTGI|nr:hypothetical protein LOTGIDRAFT_174195 [Lottia gigantea]ESO98550.1 hypothetical protein LOTGIDRAFT_174195 [Lottia gigantea]
MSRFTTYVMNNTTPMILVFIAADRYIRICRKRAKRIEPRTAFYACGMAVVIGISVSWPSLILYGRREIMIPLPGRNVTGVMCLVESRFKGTVYPFIFFVYLWVGVTVIGCIIVVMYTFIGKEVYRRKRMKKAKMKLVEDTLKRLQAKRRSMSNTSALTSGPDRSGEDLCPVAIKCAPNIKPGRSTLMLFAIAVVYLLSFLPFLIVITVRTICGENFYKNLTKTEEVIVNIFIRSYLFNNCFNPVVYGMCNIQFRREVRYIYYRMTKRSEDVAFPRTTSVNINPNY